MASDSKNGALGSLMVKVKESLSYNSEIYFNNKKYEITTGVTGNGLGVLLKL